MKKKIYNIISNRKECIKRSLRTFFQAFTAMLITALGGIQTESIDAQDAIIRGALTAAIAAGLAAVMNIKRGDE